MLATVVANLLAKSSGCLWTTHSADAAAAAAAAAADGGLLVACRSQATARQKPE